MERDGMKARDVLAKMLDDGLSDVVSVPVDLPTGFCEIRVLLGPPLFTFASKQDWVNKGQRIWRTYEATNGRGIAVDTRGRILQSGKYFARAEADSAYPVTVYRVQLEPS